MDDIYIIFLDIDGVLFDPNRFNVDYYKPGLNHRDLVKNFDIVALSNLNYLIENVQDKTNKKVKIVLSSAWRLLGDFHHIYELFQQHYFSNFLIDRTPHISDIDRDLEIHMWLEKNKKYYNIINYVILDDNDFNIPERFGKRFVKCTRLFDEEAFRKAYNILTKYNLKDNSELSLMDKKYYKIIFANNVVLWSIILYLWFNS